MKPTAKELRTFPRHSGIVSQPAYEIPTEVAAALFAPEVVHNCGGWAETADGVKVYGCEGHHRNGYRGWIVHSFGGLR